MKDTKTLRKYTMVAERIIYDPERAKQFTQMLRTREGALRAVNTVLAGIDQLRPIPPELRQQLAANIYLTMVSLVSEATGAKPDAGVMREVISSILSDVGQAKAAPPEPANVMERMGVTA